LGGIVCHWGWGGKFARQQRPGVAVDGRHPADLRAGLKPLLLDGVHLPGVVGRLGPGRGRAWSLGPPGAVDCLPLEGALEGPRRGDQRGGEEPEEFDADPAGAPGRVPPLELTGPTEDGRVGPRRGSSAGPIANDEALIPVPPKGPPEGADGDVSEVPVGGDLREGLAL
jgi:hypothetical protein